MKTWSLVIALALTSVSAHALRVEERGVFQKASPVRFTDPHDLIFKTVNRDIPRVKPNLSLDPIFTNNGFLYQAPWLDRVIRKGNQLEGMTLFNRLFLRHKDRTLEVSRRSIVVRLLVTLSSSSVVEMVEIQRCVDPNMTDDYRNGFQILQPNWDESDLRKKLPSEWTVGVRIARFGIDNVFTNPLVFLMNVLGLDVAPSDQAKVNAYLGWYRPYADSFVADLPGRDFNNTCTQYEPYIRGQF